MAGADRRRRELLDRLGKLLGSDGLITSKYKLALYRRDAGFLKAEPLAVCLPRDVDQVAGVIRVCRDFDTGFTPRGAGTGLAGGAVPLGRTIVIGLGRMNRILEIDPIDRCAWVEPGVENARLDRAVRAHGLRYAPDPSSQAASTIGGNVGTNAGGPHCLAHGVTSWHVLAVDLVDADGELHRFGSLAPEADGYDIRGVIIGAEGTFGIVTRICVRLLPVPDRIVTLLLAFDTIHAAAQTVSAILARGLIPVALELMDRASIRLVEQFAGAGYPIDRAAILLIELEGRRHEVAYGVSIAIEEGRRHGSEARLAESEEERARLWKGRKAIAGAMARAAPDYYLHDTVVPRTRLAQVLDEVLRIGEEEQVTIVNVAHAGDGNLHPLILFDRAEPGALERVFRAGERIVHAAIDAGGALSGEHGIGLEKRDFLLDSAVMRPEELAVHRALRGALEPTGRANPGKKVVASGDSSAKPSLVPEGTFL